jgi:hypothetical protein
MLNALDVDIDDGVAGLQSSSSGIGLPIFLW